MRGDLPARAIGPAEGRLRRRTAGSAGRPPSTLKHLVDILRATTDKILSEPRVVAMGNKRKRYIKYIPAAQAEKAVHTVLAAVTPEQKARIKKAVLDTR